MADTEALHDRAPEHVAVVLRERIYGGIACLSTLLVIVRNGEPDASPWSAAIDVAISAGALWAASVLADHVAHLSAHGRGPSRSEAAVSLRASAQILEASAAPLVLLILAGPGWIPSAAALTAGVWISVVTLGLFAFLAARRTGLAAWKQGLLVLALLGLGVLVVAVKSLAH